MNRYAVTNYLFSLVDALLANIFKKLTILKLLIFENIYNCGQFFQFTKFKKQVHFFSLLFKTFFTYYGSAQVDI